MPSSHLILCRPLLLLPPIPPGIRVFSDESTLHMRWPKYWSFSFSIIPSKEVPGLIFLQNGLVGKQPNSREKILKKFLNTIVYLLFYTLMFLHILEIVNFSCKSNACSKEFKKKRKEFPGGPVVVKNPPANAEGPGSVPGPGRLSM